MADQLEDAPWASGAGGDGLPDAPWAKPEKPPIAWSDIPGQAMENLPESAGKFIHPFLHPIETAKGMAGLSGGLAEKAAPYLKGNDPLSAVVRGAAAGSKYLGGHEQMADEFGQQMKDRYGGLENVKHTLAEDPVGAAADLSMVLTGGGSAASRLPGMAGRVGEVAGRVGSAIDPLRPVTKGIEKVGELIEPAKKIWNREQGVRLSAGQRAPSDERLPLIQREQAALRGQSGEPAQKHAQQFHDQQAKELGALNDEIRESLDPHGSMVEDPVQAGQVVSQGMRDTYDMRRKVVSDHFYNAAKQLGGNIDASWFDNIADRIKTDLSSGHNPIVIEDKLTPFANQALRDVEQQVETLRVPRNNAQPGGHPSRSQIVGVSLEGVDQIRRRLASWRDQAFASGNAADGRATQAVLRSFENDMDVAVNSQAFSGDARAPQAWNEARKAHSEVRETFGAGKRGDSAGQEVERILGRRGSAPLTASDTFQAMVPVNLRSSTKHVETVNRVKKALGEDSPEFAAVRQGTFSRLTETPAGVKDWGPGKIADRINKFLNGDGRELAEAIFTPEQRERIAKYGELQRKIEIPQSGANWSNSATFVQRATGRILPWVGAAAGAGAAHLMGMPWMADIIGAGVGRYAGAKYAKKVADKASLKEVAPQLPISKRRVKGTLERTSDALRPGLSRVMQGEPTPRWTGRTQARPGVPSRPTSEPIGRRVERAFSRFGPSKAKARGFGALGRYTQPYGDQNNPYASP